MAAADATLRLEGFSESLKGARSFAVMPAAKAVEPFLRARLAAMDAEVAHRGRKVLVVQGGAAPPRWLGGFGWDATFHVRDVTDLKLALTHIQHVVKPARVIWYGAEPQAAVMTALARMDAVTFMAIAEHAPVQDIWQAIFWPPTAAQEEVEPALAARLGAGAAAAAGIRSILKELRASEVGLVWSSIGESDKRGGLYWYDPCEGVETRPRVDAGEAAEMLRAVAEMLEGK